MSIGFCPSCECALNNDSVLITKQSEIFKGHNKYAMCKHCGYVMIYNETRGILYSLDKYKEDKDVLLEVSKLLQEVDPNLIINEEPTETCTHNCESCTSCKSRHKNEMQQQIKLETDSLIFINKKTKETIISNEVDFTNVVKNIDEYDVFTLAPVYIEPVITYKIHRM